MKAHFTEVQNAHNALESELDRSVKSEAQARQSADDALTASIAGEKSERSKADTKLKGELDNKASELYEAIKSEAKDRLSSDVQFASQLSAEQSTRQNADEEIKTYIEGLQRTSHSHENAVVLAGITADDVAGWRDKTDHSRENLIMLEYLEEFCRALSQDINKLYGGAGVMLYDGGADGEIQSGAALDGGDFDNAEFEELDCGTLDINVFATAAVVDGGQY